MLSWNFIFLSLFHIFLDHHNLKFKISSKLLSKAFLISTPKGIVAKIMKTLMFSLNTGDRQGHVAWTAKITMAPGFPSTIITAYIYNIKLITLTCVTLGRAVLPTYQGFFFAIYGFASFTIVTAFWSSLKWIPWPNQVDPSPARPHSDSDTDHLGRCIRRGGW